MGKSAVSEHHFLATFILITEAPSNRCLVTNTFEIDLLTYYEMLWKDLRLKFTDGGGKQQKQGKVKVHVFDHNHPYEVRCSQNPQIGLSYHISAYDLLLFNLLHSEHFNDTQLEG